MSDSERLRVELMPPLDEARIACQWSAIEAAGLPGGTARGSRWLARPGVPVVAALSLAAVLVFTLHDRQPPEALPSGAVVGSVEEPIEVQLRDGSAVSLSARSEVRVVRSEAARVEVELSTGRAHFAVSKRPERRFVVRAGAVRVTVVGTRFAVERTAGRVEVQVDEGIVEVSRQGDPDTGRRLRAGESWSMAEESAPRTEAPRDATEQAQSKAPADEPPAAAEAPLEGASDETADPTDGVPAAREEATVQPSHSRRGIDRRKTKRRSTASERSSRRGNGQARGRQEASHLFRAASLARRAGRMREAAAAYNQLLSAHPDDKRVALCAFELGRIRMDMLADPRGAVTAFEQSLASGASGGLREDALARLVLAHDKLGHRQACARARKRYLSRYPSGVHAAAVAERCPH